jgi:hypothetical protein
LQQGYAHLPDSYNYEDYPSHLFRSGAAPTTTIQPYLRSLLVDTRVRIRQFDEEILQLERKMKSLLTGRDEIVAFERSQRRILYRVVPPIGTIPMELVMEILLHAAGYYYDSSYEHRTTAEVTTMTTNGPWVYAQVNRTWRTACLSLPVIWATIGLLDHVPQHTEAVQELLRRSQQLPLDVTFHFEYDSSQSPGHIRHVVEGAVTPLDTHRWRSVTFVGWNDHGKRVISSYNLPSLTSFTIVTRALSFSVDFTPFRSSIIFFALSNAPQLRRVILDVCLPFDREGSGTTWSHVTHLTWSHVTHLTWGKEEHIVKMTVDDELDVLNCLPNLVEYRTRGSRGRSFDLRYGAIPEPITLRSLKMLELFQDSDAIPYLILPALEVLHISYVQPTLPDERRRTLPLNCTPSLLRRSECRLKELKVKYQGSFDGETVPFLEMLRGLECESLIRLHLILTDYDLRLVEGLDLSLSPSTLPSLETLMIANELEPHCIFNVEPIVKLVYSRQTFLPTTITVPSHHRQLQTFHYAARIWAHQKPSPASFQPFNELRKVGMDVDFGLGLYDERYSYDENEDAEDYLPPSEDQSDVEEEYDEGHWSECSREYSDSESDLDNGGDSSISSSRSDDALD